jgi:hypothetical protein
MDALHKLVNFGASPVTPSSQGSSGRNPLILRHRRRGHFYSVVVSRRIISNLLTRAAQFVFPSRDRMPC